MTPREEKYEKALSQIVRMARVPLNDRESPGSQMWRQDVACIAMLALGMEPPVMWPIYSEAMEVEDAAREKA